MFPAARILPEPFVCVRKWNAEKIAKMPREVAVNIAALSLRGAEYALARHQGMEYKNATNGHQSFNVSALT